MSNQDQAVAPIESPAPATHPEVLTFWVYLIFNRYAPTPLGLAYEGPNVKSVELTIPRSLYDRTRWGVVDGIAQRDVARTYQPGREVSQLEVDQAIERRARTLAKDPQVDRYFVNAAYLAALQVLLGDGRPTELVGYRTAEPFPLFVAESLRQNSPDAMLWGGKVTHLSQSLAGCMDSLVEAVVLSPRRSPVLGPGFPFAEREAWSFSPVRHAAKFSVAWISAENSTGQELGERTERAPLWESFSILESPLGSYLLSFGATRETEAEETSPLVALHVQQTFQKVQGR